MSIRVNFSETEASSESLAPLPAGKYRVAISDVELRESKSEKNSGKPYYAFEFTVQDGPYEGRKAWTNAMLWDGALYTIVRIMKSLNMPVVAGDMDIPEADDFIGKELLMQGKVQKQEGYDDRFEPRSFFSLTGAGATASSGKDSLLP